MLSQVEAGDRVNSNNSYDGRWDVYFWVEDADQLFAEFKAKGADIVCEPSDKPYGIREFQIQDIDGHLLAFGQKLA
jgi:uncharacterized glyoxalase superfamily protein PhnB